MTWNRVGQYDVSANSTINVPIPDGNEVLIYYGWNNGEIQVFGGGSIVLAKDTSVSTHPCVIPWSTNSETGETVGIAYMFLFPDDNLALSSKNVTTRFVVFYR